MKRPVLLIVESDGFGHRFSYVRVLANEALRRGWSVTILASKTLGNMGLLQEHLTESLLEGDVNLVTMPSVAWKDIVSLSQSVGSSLTLLPDGDRNIRSLVVHRGWRGEGTLRLLLLRDPWGARAHSLRRSVSGLVKRACVRALHSWGRTEFCLLGSMGLASSSPLAIAPDPIEFEVSQKEVDMWDLADGVCWFGVVGAVSARKNVPLVCAALGEVDASAPVGLLIAGLIEPIDRGGIVAAVEELAAKGIPVRLEDRLLSDSRLNAAVKAVHCLVIAHSNEGPSGLFGKAMAAGTRAVCAGAQSLRRDCELAPDAAEWVPLDTFELSKALGRAVDLPSDFRHVMPGAAEFADVLLAPEPT